MLDLGFWKGNLFLIAPFPDLCLLVTFLFERAFDENEISQVPVCFYVKNDILMRKWRPPVVSAEDEWTVNHQIVVPKAYHPEILNLAHETPMSGHLGINNLPQNSQTFLLARIKI